MTANNKSGGLRLPVLQGVLPINVAQLPGQIVAGVTLAVLAIPGVTGCTKISRTPVIAGLYMILIPTAPSRRLPPRARFLAGSCGAWIAAHPEHQDRIERLAVGLVFFRLPPAAKDSLARKLSHGTSVAIASSGSISRRPI